MLRKIFVPLFIAISLISCSSTTDVFVDEYTYSDVPVEEKLEHFGVSPVMVDSPERFYNGRVWLDRLMELTESCEDYIFISTFMGSSSETLEPFYELLMEKAEAGVDVYLVMDSISSLDMTESNKHMTPLYFLRERGVHVVEYSPMSATRIVSPSKMLLRDHRKLFVFDGRSCAIGGMNINYISMGAPEDQVQRDSMYYFRSEELTEIFADEFVNIWNSASVEKIDRKDFATYPPSREYSMPAYLFNQGSGGEEKVADLFATLINSAEKEIMMLPYLPILDENMLASIKNAVERGVEVTIVMPIDSRGYGEAGGKYFLPKLVETGANVIVSFIEDGSLPMLHEKLMVVDGRWSVIGSTNFNYRSMQLAHEIALAVDSEEFAAMNKEHIRDRLKDGGELVDLETARKWKKEDGSWFAYMFVYYGG